MKFSIDDKKILELTKTQKDVLRYNIFDEDFESEMIRLVNWVILHNYEQAFKEIKRVYEEELANSGIKLLPVDKDELAELIFKLPGYKSRSQRDHKLPDNVLERKDL